MVRAAFIHIDKLINAFALSNLLASTSTLPASAKINDIAKITNDEIVDIFINLLVLQ
jgi:hypothetical protein